MRDFCLASASSNDQSHSYVCSKMTRIEACLRNIIAKKIQMRGVLWQRDFRVRHKQQQQQRIMTQPLLTNKLNRRNIYRQADNAFEDMQHYYPSECSSAYPTYVTWFILPTLKSTAVRKSWFSQSWTAKSSMHHSFYEGTQEFVKWLVNLCPSGRWGPGGGLSVSFRI